MNSRYENIINARYDPDGGTFYICRYAFAHESRLPKYMKDDMDSPCGYPDCWKCNHSKPHRRYHSYSCSNKPTCIPVSKYNLSMEKPLVKKIFKEHMFNEDEFMI